MKLCQLRALFSIALFTCVATAQAAVHRVQPGESIQAAVDNAAPGDTILVEPGTYRKTPATCMACTSPLKTCA